MTEISELDIFIFNSLKAVDDHYFKTVINNINNLRNALRGYSGEFSKEDFHRYSERVFCYEFYHQMRIRLDEEKRKGAKYFGHAVLQGELKKMNICRLIERFNLESLSKEFAPDFLIHEPDSTNNQLCAIEVKAVNNLSEASLLYDLQKLDEFVSRFQFKHGYSINVNCVPNHLTNLLQSLSPQIANLAGRDKIKVICIEGKNKNPQILKL